MRIIRSRTIRAIAEKLAKLIKINTFHTTLFAYFLEKLRSTADGDGSLLDHVTLIYGAGMSDSNAHDPHNLPILLVGGGAASSRAAATFGIPKARRWRTCT